MIVTISDKYCNLECKRNSKGFRPLVQNSRSVRRALCGTRTWKTLARAHATGPTTTRTAPRILDAYVHYFGCNVIRLTSNVNKCQQICEQRRVHVQSRVTAREICRKVGDAWGQKLTYRSPAKRLLLGCKILGQDYKI